MNNDHSQDVVCWALLPASGKGHRIGADRPKQYLELEGHTILEHTLERLLSHPRIHGVVLVLSPDDSYWKTLNFQHEKPVVLATGGRERIHSVANGLEVLSRQNAANPLVLIHDAVRPFVPHTDISRLIEQALSYADGALLATPVADTLKQEDASGRVAATRDRSGLWRAFTPQAFFLKTIQSSLSSAIERQLELTDDASAMEVAGFHPQLVECDPINIKITQRSDLKLAEMLLKLSRD